jgi:hypothetical protein
MRTKACLTLSLLVPLLLLGAGLGPAAAKITAKDCYRIDSSCTHVCPNWDDPQRCFKVCDGQLNNCLDAAAVPDLSPPPTPPSKVKPPKNVAPGKSSQ